MQKLVFFIYDTCLGFLAKIIGLVMLLSVVVQIACRYLPMAPLRWTEELARLSFIWYCFMGAATTLAKRKHLTIDYFYLKLNTRIRKVLDVLSWGVVIGFSSALTVYGVYMVKVVSIQRSPMLDLSMSLFYGAVPAGCFLFAFYGLVSLIACLRGDNTATAIKEGESR
ncbi:MAG: TRAP transporter small permease [Spirochaetales bacterium]|jgi:TRAP-type C4-dicarboxylate transport system permease small subunit|nr:TRAP transporter small permease [Spirochaetales bacterium]